MDMSASGSPIYMSVRCGSLPRGDPIRDGEDPGLD